ncbi:MAG: type I DNA topoisomerase [Actinobacteria bacterium]|uniref:DNA topoisomerase n=1 Tax=freshwater metagenome TaxID=449393 RepID=A0A6J6C177_9ZZZZ|nr:type I DNA topoisomerase [Actinomycetota bacterium]
MAKKKTLVIVESPAKAKKIGSFLGSDYVVEASLGHIRDLPQRAADIPADVKKEKWAKEGVNVDKDFEPLYVINPDKKKKVSELKALLKDADELFLATDEDREGEAIAWHLLEILKPKVPVRRMVFHEITKDAILAAANDTRELDQRLVDAQETRRILDRLYGYRLSPVLWKKVMPRISAGRVQSIAMRLVVERERERQAFVASDWWDITAHCALGFNARLLTLDGAKLAASSDFDANGKVKDKSTSMWLKEHEALAIVESLEGCQLTVKSTEESPRSEKPKAPFTTSTLQQDAGSRLGWGAQLTMRVAQRLYENGYITYMRTDSVTLAPSAIESARTAVKSLYGADYLPDSPRMYTGKTKNAQEAHEAIRPAGDVYKTPGELAKELTREEFSLYDLIWKRTIASQMADAKKMQMRVDLETKSKDGKIAGFRANGSVVTFPGYLAAYEEIVDDKSADLDSEVEMRLPPMKSGDVMAVTRFVGEGHQTKPPARYTEPSLVKKLEELGVGRPSTFASTIQTIQDRGYVAKRGRALIPSFLAFSVTGLLEQHFPRLIDYDFTASMEEDLDKIALGEENRVAWLKRFFFGHDGIPGLAEMTDDLGAIDAREVNTMNLGDGIEIRVGRYGAYLQKGEGENRIIANIPEDLAPDELNLAKAHELFARPSGERQLGAHPESGLPLVAKTGRFGPYIVEVLPEDTPKVKGKAPKPRTASLFSTMSLDTVTIEEALKLFGLPRVVGVDPNTSEEITAQNGPYGPYLRRGKDSRQLASEDQIFTCTLEEAQELYAQPKRRGRGVAKGPLKDLGPDPVTGKSILVKDGKFGTYVTDGETNATLRRGDIVELLTLERGMELLAEKRARATQD